MIRLMGILTGSALAVAMLIVALGLPKFSAEEEAAAEPEVLAASIPAPDADTSREPGPAPEPQTAPEPQAMPEPQVTPEPQTAPEPQTSPKPLPEPELQAEAGPAEVPDTEPQAVGQNWYAFWSPFRSEIAADGFILELQRTTGLDYRVVKLKPGIYEVAFAYSDDADIADKLNRISTATGLDMSGG